MNVVYVLNSNSMFDGSAKSFMTMLNGLIKKKVSPLVVLPQAGGLQTKLQDMGVKTLVLNYRPNIYPYDSGLKDYMLWLPRLIYRRYLNYRATKALSLKLRDYDLVHTNVSVIDIGSRAAKIAGKPHIYHFREYGDLDFSYKYYPSKRAFMHSVTNSICITRGIQKHHGLSDDTRSQVIYNPIVDNVSEMPRQEKQDYILFAGRVQATKGIDILLEAYSKSACRYRLLIAGDSTNEEYGQKIKAFASELGLSDRVKFLGNRTDIADLMQRAQAVIVPSLFEGFGRTAAEAMFNGTLVVGHSTAGTKEQLDNGLSFTGKPIAIAYKSMEELEDILSSLDLADEDMLNNAFATVCHFYSAEACVDAIYDLYKRILRHEQI